MENKTSCPLCGSDIVRGVGDFDHLLCEDCDGEFLSAEYIKTIPGGVNVKGENENCPCCDCGGANDSKSE